MYNPSYTHTLTSANQAFPTNDYVGDTVQEIRFGNNTIFAAAGWDGFIRIYEVQIQMGYRQGIAVEKKYEINCGEPVISISWKSDMTMIFAALADFTIRAYELASGQGVILGVHEGCPARQVFWNDELGLISLGLDKNLRFWQLQLPVMGQKPKPYNELQLSAIPTVGEQDGRMKHFVYADLDQKVKWIEWDKLKGSNISSVQRSPWEYEDSRLGSYSQISAVALDMGQKTLAYASVDGRACILDINQRLVVSSKLVFKVYKVDEEGRGYRSEKIQKYYSVNSMQINHRGRSLWLSTTGSEGSVTFWDIEKKNKILNLTYDKTPVTASQLSPDGQCLAFGLGYDWSRGLDGIGEYSSRVGVIQIEDKHLQYGS